MDPISNMINSLKTAGAAGKETVIVGYSKMKENIAEVLKKEGFIRSYEKKTIKGKPALSIELIIENRIPRIKGVKRISKPGKRVYTSSTDVRGVKGGYGALVLSTPAGIMTGREAKKSNVGGEALFQVW